MDKKSQNLSFEKYARNKSFLNLCIHQNPQKVCKNRFLGPTQEFFNQ